MTQAPANTTPPDAPEHVDDALDEALDESFPSSDPIAIGDGTLDKPKAARGGKD